MEPKVKKERTRGVPRKGVLLTVSAALLMAGPVASQVLAKVVENYYSSIPLFYCLLVVAGGVLLLTSRGRRANDAVGGALALFGAAVLANGVLILVAVAAWAVSALGTSWNKVPGVLPEKFRMPVLNLVAAVVLLLTILLDLRYRISPLYLLPRALSFVGALLLCVNVEPRTYLPQSAQTWVPGEKGVRYRSVPKAGALTILGALFLVGDGVDQLMQLFRSDSFAASPLGLLWPLLVVAAGVMLLLRTNRERWTLVAAALLLVCQFRTLIILRQVGLYSDSGAVMEQIQAAALLFLGVLLLLLQLFGLLSPYFEPLSLTLSGLIAVVSALLLAVSTWPLYAFGQIVADLHAIRQDGVRASGTAGEAEGTGSAAPKASAAQENPDELPEL